MKYAKAIAAAVAAAATALGVALTDGVITGPELIEVVSATLAALGIVYRIPNKPV